jgi:hypothetical protein
MKVMFKNGSHINLPLTIINIIAERILTPGSNDLQVFTDEHGDCISVIKISEILYIDKEN